MERCFYCGVVLTPIVTERHVTNPPTMKTLDHLVPKSRGGEPRRDSANVVKACFGCNNDKASLTVDEYRVVVAYRNGLIEKPTVLFNAERLDALWNE